jgi:hypothetical protein
LYGRELRFKSSKGASVNVEVSFGRQEGFDDLRSSLTRRP